MTELSCLPPATQQGSVECSSALLIADARTYGKAAQGCTPDQSGGQADEKAIQDHPWLTPFQALVAAAMAGAWAWVGIYLLVRSLL